MAPFSLRMAMELSQQDGPPKPSDGCCGFEARFKPACAKGSGTVALAAGAGAVDPFVDPNWDIISQKNPRVRKIFCPQFWGRKWLRQFYGRLEKCVLSAGKPMSIKFLLLGGGVFWVSGCQFYFYGRKDFSEHMTRAGVLYS